MLKPVNGAGPLGVPGPVRPATDPFRVAPTVVAPPAQPAVRHVITSVTPTNRSQTSVTSERPMTFTQHLSSQPSSFLGSIGATRSPGVVFGGFRLPWERDKG